MADWLDTIDMWANQVLKYVELPDDDENTILVSYPIALSMQIKHGEIDLKDKVTVTGSEYKKALFRQGHVMNYILFLSILGEPYLKIRNYLIEKQFEYVTTNLDPFKDWQNCYWFKELIGGKVTLDSLLPMVTKWYNLDVKSLESRVFQYILPMYLLLGNYTNLPEGLTVTRVAYNGMVVSDCHLYSESVDDIIYDVSYARYAFLNLVKQLDRIFYMPTKSIKISGYSVALKSDWRKVNSSALLKRAGDLLSFGAYITLLSKYARYSLPLGDTKTLIQTERQTYLGKLQNQLFAYNPERMNHGRKEEGGIEFL